MTERIQIRTLENVWQVLPQLQSFNAATSCPREISLFLCALGFESRGLATAQRLAAEGCRADKVVYFEYGTNVDDNAANKPLLMEELGKFSDDVKSLDCDGETFGQRLRDAIAAAIAGRPDAVVLFDISVAANRLLLCCMKILLEFDLNLQIAYAEAGEYRPTRDEYEANKDKWQREEGLGLEWGISDVRVSDEYPGFHVDQVPDCVVIFPSFNRGRSLAVISAVDPSLLSAQTKNIIWLLGEPHLDSDRWRLEAMRTINGLGFGNVQYDVSTFDYRQTLDRLERIYCERAESVKFTLAPMGSKLQALGASLFCFMHPDVRVLLAVPRYYNATKYSTGCKALWTCVFGSTKALRTLLDCVGKLEVITH